MACRARTILVVAILTVLLAGRVHADPVQLPDGQSLRKIDFERHVHALLDRQGCNAGKCHGNRNGRGGFSLSLLAAAPARDHAEITRGGLGRFVNAALPEQSLLLLKATGQAQHEGGIRIVPRSWEYELLRQWLADGGVRVPGSGQVTALQVFPSEHIFQVGQKLKLKVLAQFADGTREDVTCLSDFRVPERAFPLADGEPAPVRVSPTGEVHAVRAGDAGIVVVYRGQVRVMGARVAVTAAKDFVYSTIPETNFIDRAVFRELRRLNIVPSDLCSDEHFLRRVYIDIAGTLPAPAEVRAFLASKDPDKRTRKIDELLAHPRHAALLATRFCEMTELVGGDFDSAKSPRAKAAQMAHDWFRQRLQDNMPYDRIVLGVLTAVSNESRDLKTWQTEKKALESAETGFGSAYARRLTLDHYWRLDGLGRERDPVFGAPHPRTPPAPLEGLAERTAAAFLGIQLECARCHVHPLDGWTPADHRAFANVFAQVGVEPMAAKEKLPLNKLQARRDRLAVAREVFLGLPLNLRPHPDTGAVLEPRLLGGPAVDFRGDARQALVRWLVRPDNPFFARHFVNGLWQHYFGVSLVEATGSYTSSSLAPDNNTLLDLLANDFRAHQFDIRRLERTILTSRTYQLAAKANDSNKHDRTQFSHVVLHRMNPRVAADVLLTALETNENFGPDVPANLSPIEVMHFGSVGRELATGDAYKDRIDGILRRFGRKELVSRCEEEERPLSYLLHVYSTPETTAAIRKSKRIQRLATSGQPLDEIIDECFLAMLSRLPTAEQRMMGKKHLERDLTRLLNGVEDIFWALSNSKEFIMRH